MGFIVTGVMFAVEMSAILHQWAGGGMHNRTLCRLTAGASIRVAANAAVCGLAFIPVAGIPLCIIGGLVVNLTDACWKWSDQFAQWCVPLSDEEAQFHMSKARERLIAAAAEVLSIDRDSCVPKCKTEQERSDARHELKRVLKRWMLEMHPDKNGGREHAHLHTVLAAFAILDQELGGQCIDIPEMLALVDDVSGAA